MNIEKVKAKIKKLLALADDACNIHEASLAASRARKLMDTYQLERHDIDDGINKGDFGTCDASRYYAAMPRYLSTLAISVATYNDCQCASEGGFVYYKKKANEEKKWGSKLVFQGFNIDVELAIDMLNRLDAAITRLCKQFMAENHPGKYNVGIGKAFKIGAVHELRGRLEKASELRKKEFTASDGTSLMIIKEAAVAEHFGKAEYESTKFSPKDMDAYRSGFAAAKSIDLADSIEGNERKLIGG